MDSAQLIPDSSSTMTGNYAEWHPLRTTFSTTVCYHDADGERTGDGCNQSQVFRRGLEDPNSGVLNTHLPFAVYSLKRNNEEVIRTQVGVT